ncbi:Proteasome component ECM29 [Nakaseomyces bracarensis]|uniref:Proteasome component ECM29 n=1 Tax=Nakaseomyces bracarensis TaxID=273131 RepID=A0ABR4NTD0_9SACH
MEKERELVDKVDLRFALADTEEKFQNVLNTFLPPLLLKLASPHEVVRKQVFESIKSVLQRLGSLPSVEVPVLRLIEQAKSPNCNGTVALYSLLFASKGVDRYSRPEQANKLLPLVINGISKLSENSGSRMFNLLCKLILLWKPPMVASLEEDEVTEFLKPEDPEDLKFLMSKFTKFFMMIPNSNNSNGNAGIIPRGYSAPGLSAAEIEFFTYKAGISFNKDQLLRYKTAIFHFITRGLIVISTEEQMSIPSDAIEERMLLLIIFLCVASTDSSDLSELASTRIKRLHIPYEDHKFVDFLIEMFTGNKSKAVPPTKSDLQESIMNILIRSDYATTQPEKIKIICSITLNSNNQKLSSLGLSFIRHVSKRNYQNLVVISNNNTTNNDSFEMNLPSMIRNSIQTAGWPKLQLGSTTQQFALDIKQRELQYETLGDLLGQDFELVEDLSYVEFLLDSLKGDLPQCRSSVTHALGQIIPHLNKLESDSKDKLKTILRTIITDDYYKYEIEERNLTGTPESKELEEAVMATRYIAVKFANAAFPFDDADARLVNIFGTSRDNKFDIIEESFKGLQPYWFRVNQASVSKFDSSKNIKTIEEQLGTTMYELKLPSFMEMSKLILGEISKISAGNSGLIGKCLNNAIRFIRNCLLTEATMNKQTTIIQDQDWSIRIEKSLESDEVVVDAVSNYISNIHEEWFTDLLKILLNEFCEKDSSGKQVSLTQQKDKIFVEFLLQLLKSCNTQTIETLDVQLENLLLYVQNTTINDNDDLAKAANCIGIIISVSKSKSFDVLKRFELPPEVREFSTTNFATILPALLVTSYTLPRLFLRGHYHGENHNTVLEQIFTILQGYLSKDIPSIKKLLFIIIAQLTKYGLLSELDESNRNNLITKLIDQLKKSYLNDELATEVLAFISLYSNGATVTEISDLLFQSFNSKQIDYLFTVGECWSVIAGGWSSKKLIQSVDVLTSNVIEILINKFPDEHFNTVLKRIMSMCINPNPNQRKAGTIWLLSLVQFLGSSILIKENCAEIHKCFVSALVHKDQIVQESAARGLSLIYEMGSNDLKEDMIKGLFKSFTSNNDGLKLSSGAVSENTELFERDTMNTGDGGSISTYKDILNLASEVGDPGIVYQFMSLAKNSMLWSSRKGIAFSLGAIMSKSSLEKYLLDNADVANKLIPKLFRYKFDPYTVVAQSMNDIWNSLIVDTKKTVETYFDVILEELLTGMGNKEWRVREASTAALLNLVQTQPESKFSDKILQIWTMAFRSMDDIKESVREIGTKFTSVLSKMLVKSIDTNKNVGAEKSKKILSTILPFLLGTKGINSDAEDVKNFALKLLLDLVKNSPKAVAPFAPELIFQFTTLFSSLEPQVINYLSLNATNYNINTKEIDKHRGNGIATSPLFETISTLISNSEEDIVSDNVDASIRSIKKSIGLPSRVAAAQVLVLLIKRYNVSLKPYCGKLLKQCFNMFEDRNEEIAISYSRTFGYTFKIVSPDKALKYAKKLKEFFFSNSHGHSKLVVGTAIESIFKSSPSEFADLGAVLVPIIFVGQNDLDKNVSKLYSNIWTETSSSGAGNVKLYFEEILALVRTQINSADYANRRSCAKSITSLSKIVNESTKEKIIKELFDITLESLSGRSWDGKEDIVTALVSLAKKSDTYYSNNQDLKLKVENILLMEVSRNNKKYVKAIISSYLEYLQNYPSQPLYEKLPTILNETVLYIDNNEGTKDSSPSNKRIKTDTVNQHLTQENVEAISYVLKILKETALACTIASDGYYPFDIFNETLRLCNMLLTDHKMSSTWRVKEGVCKVIYTLTDNFPSSLINDKILSDMKDTWNTIFQSNSPTETTENVKIETVRLGGLLSKKFPDLEQAVSFDLRTFTDDDISTTRLAVELKNIGI